MADDDAVDTPTTSSAAVADSDGGARSNGPGEEQERPPRVKSGRALAALALLLALIAGGGAGYVYWRGLEHADRVADLQRRVAQAGRARQDEIGRLRTELDRLRDELERQSVAARDARRELAQALASRDRPPSVRDWRLAEAEYLLRVAGARLLMERDVAGAREMVALADAAIAEFDDLLFHEVRALLAERLAALANYRGADVQGVFLRLEAARRGLDSLPLRPPQHVGGAAPAGKEPGSDDVERSWWAALLARLKGVVRIRRHDAEGLRPLLPPEQADYLEQHLRLVIDRAQLAALRRQQAVFETVLTTADEWLRTYFNPQDEAVRRLLDEFAELRTSQLMPPPPDLSEPLRRLRALRRQLASDPASPRSL